MGKEPVRGNKQIWKIAEWLYDNHPERLYPWATEGDHVRNIMYDKAVLLMKKMVNNDFTGPDDHE